MIDMLKNFATPFKMMEPASKSVCGSAKNNQPRYETIIAPIETKAVTESQIHA